MARIMMLGESLIERGLITESQLREALHAQLIFGGHLGTCLIELGHVSERQLGHVLAELFDVHYAYPEMFLDIPADITGLLVPVWDSTKCIGCRECAIDVCPYDVVTETIKMQTKKEAGKHRAFLRMHPQKAEELGLSDGDRVDVESKRGVVRNMKLELTPDIDQNDKEGDY